MFHAKVLVLALVSCAMAASSSAAGAQVAKGQTVVIVNVPVTPHGSVNPPPVIIPMQNYCGLAIDGTIRGMGTSASVVVEQSADSTDDALWMSVGARIDLLAPKTVVPDFIAIHSPVLPISRGSARVTVRVNHGIDPAPTIGLKILATPEPCGLFP
jgi:hypothetical protein